MGIGVRLVIWQKLVYALKYLEYLSLVDEATDWAMRRLASSFSWLSRLLLAASWLLWLGLWSGFRLHAASN